MKNLLLLLIATLFVVSCEDLESNSPALQAEIDNVIFKASDARASQNNNGTYLIEGFTLNETMTLKVSNINVGTYVVGGTSANYATFENLIGSVYQSNPEGSGEIVITDSNASINAISGTFNFTAMVPGVDTISVHNGVFFEVPYAGGNDNDPNDGSLDANVDGVPLSPDVINAADSGDSIVILASNGTSSIFIKVPIDVATGSYELPETGFGAKYTVNNVGEDAISGTIVIINHNVETKVVSGTFSFATVNHIIEQGQFNVSYQ